jgi:phenylpyruvate tautomerase PptA (4-oxalocrotonate tautomerase family)
MPVIRIDIPYGYSDRTKKNLKASVKKAVIDAIDPKITKFIYININEVFAELGDGAPIVTVDLRPGRETERKVELNRNIAKAFSETTDSKPEDLYLLFRETSASDHFCGGEPLPEWKP